MCYVLILKELTDDIISNKHSVILDESNDIYIIKLLGASVIYISHSSNKVEWNYQGLAQLEKCYASSI